MPPANHSPLGPSGAARWINCPGSVLLTEDMPDQPSPYAAAGTVAHTLAETKVRNYFIDHWNKPSYDARLEAIRRMDGYDKSMEDATEEYLEFLKIRAMSYDSEPAVFVETRIDLQSIIPDGFGTADCIMLGGNRMDIVDYKNGSGVAVEAEHNPQLMLYAYGALQAFRPIVGDTVEAVHLSIVQPHAGGIKEWEVLTSYLHSWAQQVVVPAVKEALSPGGRFAAGDWCRFCKARATCMERAKAMFDIEPLVRNEPNTLSPQSIGDILARGRHVADWLNDLEAFALKSSLEGVAIPGWKAVEGRGSRVWSNNTDSVFAVLEERGVNEEMLYERKPVSVAGLEKTLGKSAFKELAGDLWQKTPGKPTLVPESDKRPPFDPANAAFKTLLSE